MKTKQEICEHLREAGFIKDICSCNTGPKQETFKEDAEQLLINDYKKIVTTIEETKINNKVKMYFSENCLLVRRSS